MSGGGAVALFCEVFKLLDEDLAVGEDGADLEFGAHGFEITAQGGDVHVGAALEFGDGSLIDVEDLGEAGLGEVAGFPEPIELHDYRGQFYLPANLGFCFGRKRSANVSPFVCHLSLLSNLRQVAGVDFIGLADCRIVPTTDLSPPRIK